VYRPKWIRRGSYALKIRRKKVEGKTEWDEADEQNDERWLEEKEKENG